MNEPDIRVNAVADPGFPGGRGANSKSGCETLLFSQFFPKNLKEFRPEGSTRIHCAPLDPPMKCVLF